MSELPDNELVTNEQTRHGPKIHVVLHGEVHVLDLPFAIRIARLMLDNIYQAMQGQDKLPPP